ncbi:PTS transporter subunit EIIC [Vibrio sp. YIC-376]|uniref:PTS transporter subunit EIIC n=1 Tax=Vibrio sp. YIC-376 TaxID=3136162 RepID=UPI00402A6BFF
MESTYTENKKNLSLGSRVIQVVSDSFSPIIGVMAGAGMLKALLAILVMTSWLSPESSTYLTLSAAGNAVFYFLPVMLGSSIAVRLGANGYIGATVGAALLEPNFIAMIGHHESTFMGIPFTAMSYASTVFPIFIAITALALLEKRVQQFCPSNVKLFLVPMICLLIIVPMTATVFGPIGIFLGNLVATGIDHLQAYSSMLTGAVIGASIMFLVIFGLHWGIFPVVIASAAAGGDSIFPMWAPSTFAQIGVAFAICLRARNTEVRTLAGPAALTGLLAGVTEPIIYGLILRYRRTIPIVVISGMLGGALNGYFQVKMTAFAFQSIFTIPVFTPALIYVLGIAVAFSLAMLLTLSLGYDRTNESQRNDVTSFNYS